MTYYLVGCTLGALIVWDPIRFYFLRISHAHINLLGWVGMMIVGVSYHFFPRFSPVEFRLDSTAGTFTFRATEPLHLPDPLLYWAATLPSDSAIPADALLLGSLSRDRYTSAGAPLAALAPGGVLLIWDGGHGRLVAKGPAHLPLEGGSAP